MRITHLVAVAIWSGADDRGRAQLADQLHELRPGVGEGALWTGREATAARGVMIPPQARHVVVPVLGEQLGEHPELGLHKLGRRVLLMVCQPAVGVWAHVVARLHTIFLAGGDELLDHVFSVGRMHDRVVGPFGVPQAEASFMVRGQADFAGAEGNGSLDPLVRAEVRRIELRRRDAIGRGADAVVLDA